MNLLPDDVPEKRTGDSVSPGFLQRPDRIMVLLGKIPSVTVFYMTEIDPYCLFGLIFVSISFNAERMIQPDGMEFGQQAPATVGADKYIKVVYTCIQVYCIGRQVNMMETNCSILENASPQLLVELYQSVIQ